MLQTINEFLEYPGYPRINGPVIAGQDWSDGWQAAVRLLGLRADPSQEADLTGDVYL